MKNQPIFNSLLNCEEVTLNPIHQLLHLLLLLGDGLDEFELGADFRAVMRQPSRGG